jgi:crotonobetainyl-CoA:carnitine CoA-transferase CaiB-like acyl-CoA transferase
VPREGNSKHARVVRISYTLSRDTTLSRTPGRVRLPAPMLGQHTDAILHHLGYNEATIARYRAEGVV